MTIVNDIESRLTHHGGKGKVIYRHRIATRITHWTWAIALFFLLLSGLQIFNAHPELYIGQQSGFEFDNSVLSMRAMQTADGKVDGYTTIFGRSYKTTGVFGMSGPADNPSYRGFPAWATLPSYQDLSTGRVIHFFFAWFFVAAFLVWFVTQPDQRPSPARHSSVARGYQGLAEKPFRSPAVPPSSRWPLQRPAEARLCRRLLVIFPLIILTGITMSPGMNAAWPWLLDVFGGRQTARTIHFICMALLVAFFLVHIFMVVAAGPLNEMRSIITGWYRTDPDKKEEHTA